MSDNIEKTQADHLGDTLTQLKEMRHYSKNNVESLTAMWMMFDSDLKNLKQTDKFDDLMNRQGHLHDALEATIADLEALLAKMEEADAE